MTGRVRHVLALAGFAAIGLLVIARYLGGSDGEGRTVVMIATVNNRDMTVMQRLSPHFEAEHPDTLAAYVSESEAADPA